MRLSAPPGRRRSCVPPPHTCAKYSSEIRPAHSTQSRSGLQGFATSAHLINILFMSRRLSGEFLMLAGPPPSPSPLALCGRGQRRRELGARRRAYRPARAASTHGGAALLDGGRRLVDAVGELADVLKVPGHLRGQHHVYDGLPQGPELVPGGRGHKVNIWIGASAPPRLPRLPGAAHLSVFLKMLLLASRVVSWKARAAWWLSSTAVSL